MPTVSIAKTTFVQGVNRPSMTDDEARDLCFRFGIELDEVTSEAAIAEKETGKVKADASTEIIYKIDIPANRYDLLCTEGLIRALRVFNGLEATPEFRLAAPAAGEPLQMKVLPETAQIRPFVVCAVLRNVRLDAQSYQSFIDLQEKLHQNICRKRTLVAIGTHDLDTLTPPFTYEARAPKDIRFIPLKQTTEFDGVSLFEHYESDVHLKPYLNIIRHSPVYPVIYDSKGVVLSLPPIINGEHSKITVNTRNVFIECTATDLTKANVVLNTIIAMFSQYCADKFTVEPVKVTMPDGVTTQYPHIEPISMRASCAYINQCIGIQKTRDEIKSLLAQMQLPVIDQDADGDHFTVSVPITRSDVLHECDIMEDVAIAFGLDAIPRRVPPVQTVGYQQPLNKLSDQLRRVIAEAGYTELLTFALASKKDNYTNLRLPEGSDAVIVANPMSSEYEIVRTTLIPGVLKTIHSNRALPMPLQLFELSDVVLMDATSDVGARNQRRLCAAYTGATAGFELIHGLLDRLLLQLGYEYSQIELKENDSPTFLKRRGIDIYLKGKMIGVFGVLHPAVLKAFELKTPTSVLEINVEAFLSD